MAEKCNHCSVISAGGCPVQRRAAHGIPDINVVGIAKDVCLQVQERQFENDLWTGAKS